MQIGASQVVYVCVCTYLGVEGVSVWRGLVEEWTPGGILVVRNSREQNIISRCYERGWKGPELL